MKPENLGKLCREAVFLQQQAHRDIAFETEFPKNDIVFNLDAGLLSQAFTNLLQNAVDAIVGREGDGLASGWISLHLVESDNNASIVIEDNGRGLPVRERDRLTEPYVTTRSKGTGLGLAIVARIVEQHGGTLRLSDRDGQMGARITITLPQDNPGTGTDPTTAMRDA